MRRSFWGIAARERDLKSRRSTAGVLYGNGFSFLLGGAAIRACAHWAEPRDPVPLLVAGPGQNLCGGWVQATDHRMRQRGGWATHRRLWLGLCGIQRAGCTWRASGRTAVGDRARLDGLHLRTLVDL